MNKLIRLSALLLSLLAFQTTYAQNPSKITLKGAIIDTTGMEIPFATVMLLTPKDSTLVNFTRSDDKGAFQFKNVKNAPYLLKISYVGYIPYQQHLPASGKDVNDLGILKIKPITNELMEVVIRTAKSTLSIRGDTIEYDASSFKVPPGSTVEDLLRRLPGIELDADGNIKAQGKDVKRVYVDGKTFFGDDPKAATKNLGAETISKVQVYNEQSEQSKLTGVDDGKKEKAMNLELKDEFKKGSFGKLTAAGGSESRWAGRGSFNRFNSKEQLSFIGFANNINQTGVNWEDYGEFKGQNAFNNNDNGDFGFGGGNRYYYMDGGDAVMNNFDGRGFTKNHGGGANYNFDNKKTKLNASYFYNQTRLSLDQYSLRQTFLQKDSTIFNTDTTNTADFRRNHSISTRWEQNLDSNDVLIVKASTRFSKSDVSMLESQVFSQSDGTVSNSLNLNNSSGLNSWRLNSSAIFRHRFKKKGRSIAASAAYNNSNTDGTENLFSLNQFFEATNYSDQVRQLNNSANSSVQYKSSLLFTEPIAKVWYLETFYNFSKSQNLVNRQVLDPESNNTRIDALSVFYDNDVLYNRIGSSIRYSNKGMNVSAGVAGQQIQLKGSYAVDEGAPLLNTPIDRTYQNLTPNVQFSYEFKNNKWLSADYSYQVREPRLDELQPVPNVNNPAFRIEGNPDLSPERSHNIGFNFNSWNPATFSNFGIGSNYNVFDSRIVYSQTIELIDSVGVRNTSRPQNVDGGSSYEAYFWSGFPIIKTKLTVNFNGSLNGGKTPAFVNNVQNETTNNGYDVNIGLNATPNAKIMVGVNGSLSYNKIRYSIQSEQNQNIQNYGLHSYLKWQFAPKFFLESNYDYNNYKNDRFDFNQGVPIWNASVRRLVGKTNKVELRLAAFDIFNRRVSINQSGNQNYAINSVSNTLARYFMLSVSYNVRGYEDKLKKNDWF